MNDNARCHCGGTPGGGGPPPPGVGVGVGVGVRVEHAGLASFATAEEFLGAREGLLAHEVLTFSTTSDEHQNKYKYHNTTTIQPPYGLLKMGHPLQSQGC